VAAVALGGAALVAGGGGAGGLVTSAHADPPAAGSSCTLKGNVVVPKGVEVFDAASGGRLIARFTGARLPLALSEVPADAAAGRARVATSLGQGLRIEGWASGQAVPAFTVRDAAVVASHVWITAGQRVKLVGDAGGSISVEKVIAGSAGQSVRATGPCDAFALEPGGQRAMEAPGSGRGYTMRSPTLELFEAPNGASVFTLRMSEGSGQLFWSTESRAGFVRVASRGDVAVEAWARVRDLEPLKKGEMMDQAAAPVTVVDGAELALDKPPPLVRATKDIPVRARRDDKERPIGVIEAGGEVYVLETIVGWANVLPKGLGVMPPADGGFWIPSSEVPK
jgi:hypothetical protein